MDRYELYYNFVHSQILEQNTRLKTTQGRAISVMTLATALLGVTGLIVSDFIGEINSLPQILASLPAVAVVVCFTVSIFLSTMTMFVRKWYISPHPNELRSHIPNPEYEDDGLVEWVADGMTKAYHCNNEILDEKSKYLELTMRAFWCEVAFLVVLVITVNL